MENLDLVVMHDDNTMVVLDRYLVEKQGLGQERIDIIKALHQEKHRVFKMMEETDDSAILKDLAHLVETLEFQLQEAWKFPKDRNYHRWWEVPKCTCPKMDNQTEYYGTKYRSISRDCPVHKIS